MRRIDKPLSWLIVGNTATCFKIDPSKDPLIPYIRLSTNLLRLQHLYHMALEVLPTL